MLDRSGPVTKAEFMSSTICVLGGETWLVDDQWAEAVEKVLSEFAKYGVARRVGINPDIDALFAVADDTAPSGELNNG
jgi:hypothetical protein